MQKTTIFTLFFSILVVVLVAELLTNDHLRDGWTTVLPVTKESQAEGSIASPPETQTQAQVPASNSSNLSGSFIAPVVPPEISATGEVAQFVSQTGYKLEGITTDQLQGMGFTGMHFERVSADGLLFQVIDVTDIVNLSKVRFNLTDGKNVYGVLTEFLLADNAKAGTFYDVLKQKGSAFAPDIKLNEVNTFGAHSFYLNDSKRLGTAFLVVQEENRVFTFSYPKASHDFFKKLIQLLAKKQ
ncbi:MAG: hypothetical protein WC101_00535 [Candidatus Gracilibacteria bacterium]